jgi:signal transduction histidine kinase/ligand-binding sensor domain-containing protein
MRIHLFAGIPGHKEVAAAITFESVCKIVPFTMPHLRDLIFRSVQFLLSLAAGLILAHGTLPAQDHFDRWTIDSGLPSDWTLGIQQTPDGYLWLLAHGGLLRFDGFQFKLFNHTNTPALKSTNFAAFGLMLDHEGALWAATWQGGAIRYFQGSFTAYTTQNGLPNNHVVRIDEDSNGTIWIYTQPGLSTWKAGKITLLAPTPGSPFNPYLTPPSNLGPSLDPLLFGLWRCTSSGWQRFAYGHWSNLPLPAGISQPQKVRLDRLVEDSRHRVWFKIIGREQDVFCVDRGRLTVFKNLPSGSFACFQDFYGRLWITDPKGHTGFWKDGQFTPFRDLSTPSFFTVFEDKEHEFWVGTLNQGLHRLRQQDVRMLHLPGGPAANRIGSVFADHAGRLWVSSRGIHMLQNGVWESFFRQYTPGKWFDGQIPTSLFLDQDGSLLVGYPDQLAFFRNGKFREPSPALRFIDSQINAMVRDAEGDLWLGGKGLYHLHQSSLQHYTSVNSAAIEEVREILPDSAGGVWAATDDGLLFLKHGQGKIWKESDGLSSNHVLTLYRDKQGILWIGTADGGLNRFEHGRFQHITTQNGLYSDDIRRIFEDRFGFFWLTCSRGISRVRKQQLDAFMRGLNSRVAALHLGKAEGFSNVDCTGYGRPIGAQKSDGTLILPTQDGLAFLNPEKIAADSHPPPVVIEGCLLNHRAVSCPRGIRIQPGNEELEIRYTAINFLRPEQTRFRYQLSGLDTDWTEADTRRSAFYSHLPPGHYVFRVIAANSSGIWNTAGQSLPIVVLPPFYRRSWFTALALLSLVSATWFGHRYRISQLRRQQAAQETFARQLISIQESERRRIASELHDGLGQNLAIIRNWALLGSSQLPADAPAKEELEEIKATATEAIKEVREIAYNLGPYHLDRAGLAHAIEEMVNRVATSSGICFTTALERCEGALSRETEMNLFRIAQESINNIVKHSEATQASLTMRQHVDSIRLTVTDNGKGFPPEAAVSSSEKNGFGLVSMAERIRLLNGIWEINSVPGEGTTIEVSVKMNRDNETASHSHRG